MVTYTYCFTLEDQISSGIISPSWRKQGSLRDQRRKYGGVVNYCANIMGPATILCSGNYSSEICGLRTVNLALSHSGCRARVKAKTVGDLGLSIDGI